LTKHQVLVKYQQMSVAALKLGEALDLLHYCLSENGSVRWGLHFKKALADEGVTFPDAWHVLRDGRIYEAPEPDIKTGEWKYKVEGHTSDGVWLVIVFCFKEVDRAFLITVFSVESRGKGNTNAKGTVR
jgi:uncharacterized DUF497 family protein